MPPIHQVGARLRAAARALVRGPPGASPGFPASMPGGALDEVLITRSGHIELVRCYQGLHMNIQDDRYIAE